MDALKGIEEFHDSQSIGVEQRLYGAMIDMVIVGTACFVALQANEVLLPGGIPKARGPALIVLALLFAIEALTGRTIGKWMMHLRVVRNGGDQDSGGRATIVQTAIRAAIRWLGPLLSMFSFLTKDTVTAGLLVAIAMMIVVCQIPICYITLFRKGGTVFDLAAGTRVQTNQTV